MEGWIDQRRMHKNICDVIIIENDLKSKTMKSQVNERQGIAAIRSPTDFTSSVSHNKYNFKAHPCMVVV